MNPCFLVNFLFRIRLQLSLLLLHSVTVVRMVLATWLRDLQEQIKFPRGQEDQIDTLFYEQSLKLEPRPGASTSCQNRPRSNSADGVSGRECLCKLIIRSTCAAMSVAGSASTSRICQSATPSDTSTRDVPSPADQAPSPSYIERISACTCKDAHGCERNHTGELCDVHGTA